MKFYVAKFSSVERGVNLFCFHLRDGALEIVIPPLGVFNPQSFTEIAFAAVWTSFTAVWTYGAARSPSPVFALFSLPFW